MRFVEGPVLDTGPGTILYIEDLTVLARAGLSAVGPILATTSSS